LAADDEGHEAEHKQSSKPTATVKGNVDEPSPTAVVALSTAVRKSSKRKPAAAAQEQKEPEKDPCQSTA